MREAALKNEEELLTVSAVGDVPSRQAAVQLLVMRNTQNGKWRHLGRLPATVMIPYGIMLHVRCLFFSMLFPKAGEEIDLNYFLGPDELNGLDRSQQGIGSAGDGLPIA